jgi:hypothetical protein
MCVLNALSMLMPLAHYNRVFLRWVYLGAASLDLNRVSVMLSRRTLLSYPYSIIAVSTTMNNRATAITRNPYA